MAWSGAGFLHYHHSKVPCLVSTRIKQSKPPFGAASRSLFPLRCLSITSESLSSLSCFPKFP